VRVAGLAPGALLAVAGLGVPQPGTQIEVGGGPGAYHYAGGCDGPHNYAHFVALQARARHVEPGGLVITAEAAGQRDTVERSSDSTQVGRQDTFYVGALRVGYETRFGGFELGPGVLRGGNGESRVTPSTRFVPSLTGWAGRYGLVHGWASVFADRTLPTNRLVGIGIGHASERVRASLGLAGSGGEDATVVVDADVAVGHGLWLGAGGQFADNTNTWAALGRVGFFWSSARAERAPPEASEPAPSDPVERPPPVRPAPAAPSGDMAPASAVDAAGSDVDAGAW